MIASSSMVFNAAIRKYIIIIDNESTNNEWTSILRRRLKRSKVIATWSTLRVRGDGTSSRKAWRYPCSVMLTLLLL